METFIDTEGKKRKGVFVKCANCKNLFLTRVDQPRKYCSVDCSRSGKRKQIELVCDFCDKKFKRQKSKIKSKSGFYFCSRDCKDKAQRLGGIEAIMPNHYGTAKVADYRKFFESSELVCNRCGYDEFESSVDIHHIDANRENNNRDNLIPLCVCCHRALHGGKWTL
tara:strand:+ start:163 stop:660 length:498 start_codon:yes stop_codon:yes gene_type:complete